MARSIDKSQKNPYDSYVRALKIGAMAAGSRGDNLFKGENAELLRTLQNKDSSKYSSKGLSMDKGKNTSKYGGENKANKGYQYAKFRTQKYIEREMLNDVKKEICQKLNKSPDTTLSDLLNESQSSLNGMITPEFTAHPLLKCIDSVIQGYLAEANECTLDDSDRMLQLVVIQEVKELTNLVKNSSDTDKAIDAYYMAISLMNLAIFNVLENSPNRINADIYSLSDKTQHSKTLTAASGSKALKEVIGVFRHLKMPGFKLPGFYGTETSGYFEWTNKKDPNQNDKYALLGRSSETLYDLNSEQLSQVLGSVEKWARQEPHPKTLVLDITIDHTKDGKDDLVETVLNSPQIQALINTSKLDIILIKSEQKQTSLGTGKFAAGAACLISGSESRKKAMNKKAQAQYQENEIDDKDLSTFYRKHTGEAREAFVEAQSIAAKVVQHELEDLATKSSNPTAHVIFSNGGFTYLQSGEYTEATINKYFDDGMDQRLDLVDQKLLLQPIPLVSDLKDIVTGYSFGDVHASVTHWVANDDGQLCIRIDPGVKRALIDTPELTASHVAPGTSTNDFKNQYNIVTKGYDHVNDQEDSDFSAKKHR